MEEKILEMLQRMESRMDGLHNEMHDMRKELIERIDAVDAKVDAVDAKVDAVDAKVRAVDERVTKLQLIIETELRPNISLLAEGYESLASNMKATREIVEVMEPRLEIVERVVRRNSAKIDTMEHTIYAS